MSGSFNLSIQEAAAGRFLGIWDQPGLHSEFQTQPGLHSDPPPEKKENIGCGVRIVAHWQRTCMYKSKFSLQVPNTTQNISVDT